MQNILAEANSILENGSNVVAIIIGLIAIGGVLVTIGKLIAVLSANTRATNGLTDAMPKVEKVLAVHAEKHTSHEKNISHLWEKVNRVSESGSFEIPKGKGK